MLVTKRLWSLLVGVYRPTALSNRRLFSRFMQHRSSLRAFSASLLLPLCFGIHCESARSFTLVVFYVIWQIISCTTRWLRELHVAGLRTICAGNACRGLQWNPSFATPLVSDHPPFTTTFHVTDGKHTVCPPSSTTTPLTRPATGSFELLPLTNDCEVIWHAYNLVTE